MKVGELSVVMKWYLPQCFHKFTKYLIHLKAVDEWNNFGSHTSIHPALLKLRRALGANGHSESFVVHVCHSFNDGRSNANLSPSALLTANEYSKPFVVSDAEHRIEPYERQIISTHGLLSPRISSSAWFIILLISFLNMSLCFSTSVNFDHLYPQSKYECLLNDAMCCLSDLKKLADGYHACSSSHDFNIRLNNLYRQFNSIVAGDDYAIDDLQYIIKLLKLITATFILSTNYSNAITPESVPTIKIPDAPIWLIQ